MDIQIFSVSGFEMIHKSVGDGGDSGRIYVPKSWVGKDVTIILKEPLKRC